jgi:hypothetical protein
MSPITASTQSRSARSTARAYSASITNKQGALPPLYLVQALLAFGDEPSESFGPFCQGIRGSLRASPSRSVGRGSTQPARAIAPRCRTAILD